MEEKLKLILRKDPRLARRQVRCHLDEGRLVLQGWVGSFFEKQVAQELFRRVEGVEEIQNDLEVRPELFSAPSSEIWFPQEASSFKLGD